MINKIIIGSRKSKLSLAYTKKVKELIAKSCKFSKSKIYFKGIKTSGDLLSKKKFLK